MLEQHSVSSLGMKIKPYRSKKYLAWVKTLDCCYCGAPADDPHHLINFGGAIESKVTDIATIPLCREHHKKVHKNPQVWPQTRWLLWTLDKAMAEGILEVK